MRDLKRGGPAPMRTHGRTTTTNVNDRWASSAPLPAVAVWAAAPLPRAVEGVAFSRPPARSVQRLAPPSAPGAVRAGPWVPPQRRTVRDLLARRTVAATLVLL